IAKEVVKTKPIVILEPGKSAKAQAASLSHTGSLAPNYRVLESALEKTGIIQAYNAGELFGLLEVLQYANHREFDGATAVVTNAGGVGVLTSDLCEDNELDLAKPSEKVLEKLKQSLPSEAALGNPIDVIGDAGADRYEIAMRTLCECGEYKNMLVLLTPQMVTDPMGTAKIAVNLAKEYKNINIFPVFVGGEKVRESLEFMRKNKMVCFGYPENITRLLGLLRKQMTYRDVKEVAVNRKEIPAEIKKEVEEAVKNGLASLPQDTVNKIMDLFKIDYPKSGNFTDKSQAFAFCKKLFPKAVVLKLSAPDALHKTEMKGIYLNVDNEIKFEEAWNGLWSSINKFNLRDASVLIQEMIIKSTEIIIGVNRDKTFGNVMVFGAGGVYTEVMKDTSLRVLPTGDFDKMISETKIGAILNGVRGETPKAVKPLADVMARIQEIVLSLPQIKSIDVNPVLVTADRAAAVDFKMILK
ncbi:MAG: acetate--CoA ligase family protein, partial [Rickettsiales bacterium]|nr:acetate--CoA ligase family protein [Rickettsiales bacterium]